MWEAAHSHCDHTQLPLEPLSLLPLCLCTAFQHTRYSLNYRCVQIKTTYRQNDKKSRENMYKWTVCITNTKTERFAA